MERRWDEFYESEGVFRELRQLGRYSHVDMEFTDGVFCPSPRGWTSGPDSFELEIGNTLAYTIPLLEQSGYFQQLRAKWQPYYGDKLRRERLAEARKYCLNNLDHVPGFVERRLYFQAFQRMYHAFQEFLQALFISRRVYPIAYDKWIQEQIVDILVMPELYGQLVKLLEISHFESDEIARNAAALKNLFHQYVR